MKGDRKTILAIVLIVIAIGVVAYQLLGSGVSGTRAAAKVVAPKTVSPAPSASTPVQKGNASALGSGEYEKLIAQVSERQLAYRSPDFKNPMKPLVPDESLEATRTEDVSNEDITKGYTIKGIIWNEANPLALINGQVVGVGERLEDGALITEINPTSVKFTKRGNRYVLVLREE